MIKIKGKEKGEDKKRNKKRYINECQCKYSRCNIFFFFNIINVRIVIKKQGKVCFLLKSKRERKEGKRVQGWKGERIYEGITIIS